jgi:hypothetical protein
MREWTLLARKVFPIPARRTGPTHRRPLSSVLRFQPNGPAARFLEERAE